MRGNGGYVGADGVPRLNVLDLQASAAAPGLYFIDPYPGPCAAHQVPPASWVRLRQAIAAITPAHTRFLRIPSAACLQIQIRRMPKPVIAMVAGYAVGGGHVLHMVCDITVRQMGD